MFIFAGEQRNGIMRIHFSLSGKADAAGRCEVLLYIQPTVYGKVRTMRAGSGVLIDPKFFDKKTGVKDMSRHTAKDTVTTYHRAAGVRLRKLTAFIDVKAAETGRESMKIGWLQRTVDVFYNRAEAEAEACAAFKEQAERFLKKPLSEGYRRSFRVLIRDVERYEGYVNATDRRRRSWRFDVQTLTKDDLSAFRDYLLDEAELARKNPKLFARLTGATDSCRKRIEPRGMNTVVTIIKKLRTFCLWCVKEGITTNRPFDTFAVGSSVEGEPVYITVAERKQIAAAPLPTDYLCAQRDIFVFQCLTGCRVGDLMNLTAANITGGILVYTPHKTSDRNAVPVRVPLVDEAKAIIDRYAGADAKGRLLPFAPAQKYNDAIKLVFTYAGITRLVAVRNALTGLTEMRPINEVAASHMARRTFVGNLYFKVQDPALIGRMSGHTAGSRAFARYRKIEDETLMEVVGKLE